MKNIHGNRHLAALIQTPTNLAEPSVQIHDAFGDMASDDIAEEKRIRADKNMLALQMPSDDDANPDAMKKYLGDLHFKMPVEADEPAPPSHENVGGTVTSIPLNSQLQESFVQLSSRLRGKSAPGVEAKVAAEKMEDVYIHDGFRKLEARDNEDVKIVRSDPNLKP